MKTPEFTILPQQSTLDHQPALGTLRSSWAAWLANGLMMAILVCPALLVGSSSSVLWGQEKEPAKKTIDQPLMLFQIAGIDRLESHGKALFKKCERPDMIDPMLNWVQNDLTGLKGVDRSKPFGMMFYLGNSLMDSIWMATYVPVTNTEEFLAWISTSGPLKASITPVEGDATRVQLVYEQAGIPTVEVLKRDGYVIMLYDDAHITWNFPDPVELATRFSNKYDISFSVLARNLPLGLKTVLVEFLKTSLRSQLQQRDNEPTELYRIRRLGGENGLKQLERFVTDCEELTIGAKLDPDKLVAKLELDIQAAQDSKLMKAFKAFPGRHSQFGQLLNRDSTLTVGVSTILEPDQQKLLKESWSAAEAALTKELEKAVKEGRPGSAPGDIEYFRPVFEALQRGTEAGLVDVFVQMFGKERANYQIVGGARFAGGEEFPAAFAKLIQMFKERQPDSPELQRLEIGISTIQDVPVHRVKLDKGGANRRLYGEDGGELAFMFTPNALWFATASTGQSIAVLRDAVEAAAKGQEEGNAGSKAPILVSADIMQWEDLLDRDRERSKIFKEESAIAFEKAGHSVQFRMQPSGNSLKLELEVDDGLVKLFGRLIARNIKGAEL